MNQEQVKLLQSAKVLLGEAHAYMVGAINKDDHVYLIHDLNSTARHVARAISDIDVLLTLCERQALLNE